MSKTSARGGEGDKMVHSELSRGGCVTAYDNIALPHYLVHLPNQNDLVLDIEVEEDMN